MAKPNSPSYEETELDGESSQSTADSSNIKEESEHQRNNHTPGILYGVQDRPPWVSIALMGLQHFSISFSGVFALPVIIAGPLCFDLDRDLLNQLVGTAFFITGLTTFLQTFFGTRLPIIQGTSAAFVVPAVVLFSLKGPCPAPLTANSTMEERAAVHDVAFERIQEVDLSNIA